MKIAILGYGTVGRGVDEIVRRLHDPNLTVQAILVRSGREDRNDSRQTSSFDVIVSDPEIDLVVECLGGIEPARSYILKALQAHKAVVTSNKAVMAAHYSELYAAAHHFKQALRMEACVAGGIPWLNGLERLSRIDRALSFQGIMNGTSNYILSAMEQKGSGFSEVLESAQALGYAEADPSADIDGLDVANKTALTAVQAFGASSRLEIPILGIRHVLLDDLNFCQVHDCKLRLFGVGICKEGRFATAVAPCIISADELEANVHENYNLVSVVGSSVGKLAFYGQGAGSLPTAHAVVQDILDIRATQTEAVQHNSREIVRSSDEMSCVPSMSAAPCYDPSLLSARALFRTTADPTQISMLSAELEQLATPGSFSYWISKKLSLEELAQAYAKLLKYDEKAFVACISDSCLNAFLEVACDKDC